MAWESGTATNIEDLTNKFITFITSNATLIADGHAWTLEETITVTASTDVYYVLKGPGSSGSWYPVVTIRLYQNVGSNAFTWALSGSLDHVPQSHPEHYPGRSPWCYTYFDDDVINYWFIANGNRFIVLPRINAVANHLGCYCGHLLSIGPRNEHKSPLAILGNGNSLTSGWASTNTTVFPFWQSSVGDSGWVMTPQMAWGYSSFNLANTSPPQQAGFFPLESIGSGTTGAYYMYSMDGTSPLIPMYHRTSFSDLSSSAKVMLVFTGTLDGVLWLPGTGLIAEEIITIAGQDYIVWPSFKRTSFRDFVAIRLS